MEVFKTACYAKCVQLKPQKQQKKPAESQLRDCLKTKLIKKTPSQSVRNKDSAGTKQNNVHVLKTVTTHTKAPPH